MYSNLNALFSNKPPALVNKLLDDSTRSIKSVKTYYDALKFAPKLNVGSIIQTIEYHSESGVGGNTYEIMGAIAERPPEDHVTVIYFDSSLLYLSPVNTKSVSLEQLGLKNGDDATSLLNIAVNAGFKKLYSEDSISVMLSDTIKACAIDLELVFDKVSITQTSSNEMFSYDGGLGDIKSISSIDAANKKIDLDAEGLRVGDVVRIVSNDRLEGNRPLNGSKDARQGMFATIKMIKNRSVIINEAIRHDFLNNPRLVKMTAVKLSVSGGTYSFDPSVSGKHSVFFIKNSVGTELVNVQIKRIPFVGVNFVGCYRPRLLNPDFISQNFSKNNSHGVSIVSCCQPYIEQLKSSSSRHAYTTNHQPITADSDEIEYYGETYGFAVNGAFADGEFVAAFDTHHGLNGATFNNVIVESSSGSSLGVRGREIAYNNFRTKNAASGILVYSEENMNSVDYTENVTFSSPSISTTKEEALNVQRVRNLKLINPEFKVPTLRAIYSIHSDITIVNAHFTLGGDSDDFSSFALIKDSKLSFLGKTVINCIGSIGSASRFVSMLGTSCQVYIEDLTINGNANFPNILFQNSSDSPMKIECKSLRLNNGPSDSKLMSGDFTRDTYINANGSNLNTAYQFQTLSNGDVLNVQRSGSPCVVIHADPASGNVMLSDFHAGSVESQTLTIINKSLSYSIYVPNGKQKNISDIVVNILPSGVATWRWVNNTWYQV